MALWRRWHGWLRVRWDGGAFAGAPAALTSWLRVCMATDGDRLFLWTPVLIAAGVAAYFAIAFEPALPVALGAPLLPALAWLLFRQHAIMAPLAAAILCVALGFAAAALRTHLVAGPVLEKAQAGLLTGRVIAVQPTETGGLVAVLAPQSFAGMPPGELPRQVRVNLRLKDAALAPGATVSFRARLMPPPEPVLPGGFDYARQVWFESLGGVGFAYTAPVQVEAPAGAIAVLTEFRRRIGARIRDVIAGPAGAVSAALVTGERAAIPKDTAADLRAAGLAHVLAISGLHMMLFGGSVFWLVRAGLALVPQLALYYPIKKWAAAVALVGATFYLAISGAAIATQRAWIMITLMFVAIMLDRPALSLRNVALAAIVILLWRPESLLGASFQMSFAAVVALIAFYESDMVRGLTSSPNRIGLGNLPRRIGAYALGLAFTSIVAGAATGAIGAFHFNRIAVYSLAGNMAAMPLVGIVVMPMALLALLLMPFGFDAPALWIMGAGVDGMLRVADEVASWEGADSLVADAPLYALLLLVLGGLWLALWRESWRYLGLAPMLLGLAFWGAAPKPDVLIDRDAALFAVRAADGKLVLGAARPAYAAEQWLRHDGDKRTAGEAARSSHMKCDAAGCVYREPGRPIVAFAETLDAATEDCAVADIVIVKQPLPWRVRHTCGAFPVIDYFDMWREGSTTLTFRTDGGIDIATSRQARGARPWVQRQRKN
ncbi:MAG: ComEC/Rec2 family competence protein [Parvibaculum sp.]|uniref:ComEC/Rec2 family competence protein n=1 Tax=Parvibaculum sp. TaxID=2024848 RepID=UPI002719B5EF|nr:ComEC/Rec2 family competence protein [Parvibaculum sp.]MDO8840528.1 ComEC/Rec2 family competence protein [Parvibaculum sp.]